MKSRNIFKLALMLAFSFVAVFVTSAQDKVEIYAQHRRVESILFDSNTVWTAGADVHHYTNEGRFLETFNTLNGLRHGNVLSAVIDSAGNKWFATSGGLSRYDGVNWITYTTEDGLISDQTNAVRIDHEGNFWVGTNYGVSMFNGTDWYNYTTADGLSSNKVLAIAIDSVGNKWFATYGGGITVFDGINWIKYTASDGLCNNYVRSIAIDSAGNKWIGTYKGLSKFDGANWKTYTIENGLPENDVRAIAIDSAGNKWIGTNGGGLVKFDDSSWTKYSYPEELGCSFVNEIAIDGSGTVWVGTCDGLSKFQNNVWYSNATPNQLVHNQVDCCELDKNNNLWFGTLGRGISMYDGVDWTNYSSSDGSVGDYVTSLCSDDENLWVGTHSGVSFYDGKNWGKYSTEDGLAGSWVKSIVIDSAGNKWFATMNNGVSKFDGLEWLNYTYDQGLASNHVYSAAVDAKGDLWFGTDRGVSRFNGNDWVSYTTENGLANNMVYAVYARDKGNVWIGTEGGLSVFDGLNWRTYTREDGLASDTVFSIEGGGKGTLWFGTGKGVSRFDGSTFSTPLPISKAVTSVCVGKGRIWSTTDSYIVAIVDSLSNADSQIASNYGTVFFDENRNGLRDADEPLLPKQLLHLQPSGAVVGVGNGTFSFKQADGACSLEILPLVNWGCTTDSVINFSIVNGTANKELVFGLTLKNDKTELIADIVGEQRISTSSDTRYWLNVENQGKGVDTIKVKMDFSSILTYNSASIEPTAITANSLEWEIPDLGMFEQSMIAVDFAVADVSNWGDTIKNTITVSTANEEINQTNNTDSISQIITSSYEPNEKSEQNGKLQEGFTLLDEELVYTIHFQNINTDTASNVEVVDTLSQLLNIRSFRLLSSSDSCTFALDDNHILKVTFADIKLAHESTGESASKGYLKFSIKPEKGIEEFSEIKNSADIYFDDNPLVVTNTTLNTMVSKMPQEQFLELKNGINYVSVQLTPYKPSVPLVFPNAGTVKDFDNFNSTGLEAFLNGISEIKGGSAYIVYNTADERLRLVGYSTETEDTVLTAGWNLLYYPLQKDVQVETALLSIIDKVKLIRNEDKVWSSDPTFVNTLTELQAGKAYLVKVSEDCRLEW